MKIKLLYSFYTVFCVIEREMSSVVVQSRLMRENQRFFLNSTEVYGVQSVNLQYQNPIVPFKYLGLNKTSIIPQGPQLGNVSISTQVIDTDFFLQYTGYSGFNGYVIKSPNNTTDNFGFSSGYLTSYTSRCGIGQIPEIDVNILALGNIGKLTTSESSQVLNDFTNIASYTNTENTRITEFGAIELNLAEYATNRVLSYELNVNIERNPIYHLGSNRPGNVEINWPITVDLTFQIPKSDYDALNVRNYPCQTKKQNLSIVLKTHFDNLTVQSYSFNDMFLLGETYNTPVDSEVTVTAAYRTYINQ